MQGSMWKVATFFAVLAVGGLVSLQVQQALNNSTANEKLSLENYVPNTLKKANADEENQNPIPENKTDQKIVENSGNPFADFPKEPTPVTKTELTPIKQEQKVVENKTIETDPWEAMKGPQDKEIKTPTPVEEKQPYNPFASFADKKEETPTPASNKIHLFPGAEKKITELKEKVEEKVQTVENKINPFVPEPVENPFATIPTNKEMSVDETEKPKVSPVAAKTDSVKSLFPVVPIAEPNKLSNTNSKPLAEKNEVEINPFQFSSSKTEMKETPKPEPVPVPSVFAFQNNDKKPEPKVPVPTLDPIEEKKPEPVKDSDIEIKPSTIFPAQPSPVKPSDSNDTKMSPQPAPVPAITEKTDSKNEELKGDAVLPKNPPQGVQRPELKIEKLAPKTAVLGQAMVYQIIVRNTGSIPAHKVVVEDLIPRGSELKGSIPVAQLQTETKKLVWRLGTIQPGEENIIKVQVVPTDEGEIGSVTTVNFVAEVAAKTRITAPKLELSVNGPDQSVVGKNVSLIYQIKNTGQGDATGVVLRSLLPDELKHEAGNDLEYDVGNIPAGETREVRLTMKAISPGNPVNKASVEANGGIKAGTSSNLNIIKSVLKLTRKGPSRRFVGREATYTIKIKNESVRTVNNVQLSEIIPSGMELQNSTPMGNYDRNTRSLSWFLGQIQPQEEKEITINMNAKAVGVQRTTVAVEDSDGNRATLNAETKVEGFASLAIHEVKGKGPVAVGERVSWKFHLKNRGSAKASNVSLSCELPNNVKFVSAQGPEDYNIQGQNVIFKPINALMPGQETTIDLVMTAASTGKTQLKVSVKSDEMNDPISHEETVIVFDESQ